MLLASVGALFGVTRLLMPLALVGAVFGRRSERRAARSAPDDQAPEEPRDALPRLSRRALLARLRAGDDVQELSLRRIDLSGADLAGASFADCDLTGAHLRKANLRGVILDRATLVHADLSAADLRGTSLDGADLADCDLTRADLRGADLGGVRNVSACALRNATFDSSTRWPRGFDARSAGAIASRRPSTDHEEGDGGHRTR